MILTDTGSLIALINKNDLAHVKCASATRRLSYSPLLTTWPCLTEALYLLGRRDGFPAQRLLFQMWRSGRLVVHELTAIEVERIINLMEKYGDVPMDVADASLLVVAESRNLKQVFTLDSDFHIYRLSDGTVLDIVP